MKRVTERRGDDLRECGAQRARCIGEGGTGLDLVGADLRKTADFGEMTELVNDGALLRNQEQQQKAERFDHLSHANVSEHTRVPREKLPERRVFCSTGSSLRENAPLPCKDR
jgi:hypothetical protein